MWAKIAPFSRAFSFIDLTQVTFCLQAPLNRIMELPDELLLEICEYLQPARYEHEAYLPELLTLRPSRVAAHDAAAAVKKTSRGFLGLMTRTARVVNGNLYSSYAEFAAEAHPYAEVFQAAKSAIGRLGDRGPDTFPGALAAMLPDADRRARDHVRVRVQDLTAGREWKHR